MTLLYFGDLFDPSDKISGTCIHIKAQCFFVLFHFVHLVGWLAGRLFCSVLFCLFVWFCVFCFVCLFVLATEQTQKTRKGVTKPSKFV